MTPFVRKRERIVVDPVDTRCVDRLAAQLGVDPVVATMLVRRGLATWDACRAFFNPDAGNLLDPFLFTAMERAVQRIATAIRAGEHIVVYGDYDVDGISATALMLRYLRHRGAACCTCYLPDRLDEGYGVSEAGIAECASRGASLVITVDCGIGSIREVELAARYGIDMIVTDHHEPKSELPPALAIINHKVPGCGYPEQVLAGVGVAFKVCQALDTFLGEDSDFLPGMLELVAAGTAADIVPLTGENRILASLGFARLRRTAIPGLRSLIEEQGLAERDLSTADVVFQLAPCINAVGRLGDPVRGVELLVTDKYEDARGLAAQLVALNRERRAINEQVEQEVAAWVMRECHTGRDAAIVAAGHGWHVGVIGIVASRMVERFYRPAIVLSTDDNGIARGSGRSIEGFHLLDALDQCSDLLLTWGGHAAAAGLTLSVEALPAFRERFNRIAGRVLSVEGEQPRIRGDAQVEFADLTPRLLRIIKRMAPFGPANMRPVLVTRGVSSRTPPRLVGKGHLKLSVQRGGCVMDAIAFNMGDRRDEVDAAAAFDLAYTLDENEWNGKVSLQLKVKGVET